MNCCLAPVSHLYLRRVAQFENAVSLYPVSCEKLSAGRSDQEWLDAVLSGGARIVQLRDKESSDRKLLEKARYFREKTREAGALFLVNDRLDIALLSGADGLHVGQDDLPPAEIRILAPDLLIGQSCNTLAQVKALGRAVERRESPVSYFNIGPIYSTETKEGLKKFLGPQAVINFAKACPLPFTVMGGIKLEHVAELCAAGVKRIAVVTAVSQAEDMAAETQRWITAIQVARAEMI
ncbi:MAG: thiamine phosphate synthase [Desulfobulbaceae bacterium]|uniref:Thiamine-phosphate synthase n=1 Tax=Candidatus Desulfatifera sulfidica TaxID=2841691 RepID=A0A8J6NBE9_9BACT|nr:thiamine phosphate synthase [Candidatus Desulfatifera sulfidica]